MMGSRAPLSPVQPRSRDRRAAARWLHHRLRDHADAAAVDRCLDVVECDRVLDPRRLRKYVASVVDDPDDVVRVLWRMLQGDDIPRDGDGEGDRIGDAREERLVEERATLKGDKPRREGHAEPHGQGPSRRPDERASERRGNGDAAGSMRGGEQPTLRGKSEEKEDRAPEYDLRDAVLSRSKRPSLEKASSNPVPEPAAQDNADAQSRSERPSHGQKHPRSERRSRSLSDEEDWRERRRRRRRRRRYRDYYDDDDREYRRYLRRRRRNRSKSRSRSRSRSVSPQRSPSEEREREERREVRRAKRHERELAREERRRSRKRRYEEDGSEEREGKEYEGSEAADRERREREEYREYRMARRKRRRRRDERLDRDDESDDDYESDDYRDRRRRHRLRSRREYRDRDEDEERSYRRRYDSHERPNPSDGDFVGRRADDRDEDRPSLADEGRESRDRDSRDRLNSILRPGANGIYRPSPRPELRTKDGVRRHDEGRRSDGEARVRGNSYRRAYRDIEDNGEAMSRPGREGDADEGTKRKMEQSESSRGNGGNKVEGARVDEARVDEAVVNDKPQKRKSLLKLSELRSKVVASMSQKKSAQDEEKTTAEASN